MSLPARFLKAALFVAISTPAFISMRIEAAPELYEVPALSTLRRMPDTIPSDVIGRNSLQFVAAKGEFEPASFVIVPDASMEGVELTATALRNGAHEIPANRLDIKIVKVWFQDGTAWHSYFADPSRKELVPELLLNDEKLVRVDIKQRKNFLRVGSEYRDISYPKEEAKEFFNHFSEPVDDAKSLQPFSLKEKENKQIWVTLHVPEQAAPGIYTGEILMTRKGETLGKVEVTARVLPFNLPAPKTYYNLENPFFVSIYATGILEMADTLDVPKEEAIAQQRRIYENLRNHNAVNIQTYVSLRHWLGLKNNPEKGIDLLKTELELIKECGLTHDPLISAESLWFTWNEESLKRIDTLAPEFQKRLHLYQDTVNEVLGHTNIFYTSWDEAGRDQVYRMREELDYVDLPELKIWITTKKLHLDVAGYMFDYVNPPGSPKRSVAEPWHAIGAKVASYASPHTGPEDPDTFRRWEGLARYKANYDGSFNYKYFSQHHPTNYAALKQNLWNDSSIGTFRAFNMVHPTKTGVIDTIAWEGFREGIDDIRYATLLKQKAAQAIAGDDRAAKYQARKALMWLEATNMESADLNAVRLEMINYILKLDHLLK